MTELTADQMTKESGFNRLYSVIQEVIGVEVEPRSHFLDLGGDSMDAVIIADMVVEEFGVGPELDSFFVCDSVNDLAEKWWLVFSAPAA